MAEILQINRSPAYLAALQSFKSTDFLQDALSMSFPAWATTISAVG